jgi:hypothetical protein
MIDYRLLRASCLTAALAAAAIFCLARGPSAAADEYRDSCDGDRSRWLISTVRDAVVREGRNSQILHEGTASEQITVEAQRLGSEIVLSQKLSQPGRVIPELKATLWVRSERAGVRLYLHVIFPNQKDPRTGDILGTLIEGDEYTRAKGWQQLVCETSDKAMQNQMRLLRASYQPNPLDLRAALIDRVVVVCTLGPGKTEIFLDDLRVGPLAALGPTTIDAAPVQRPIAEIRQGQLEIAGRPRLTIMLIDHGEKLSTFKDLHANTVWIPDVHDQARLTGLREQEIRAAATPPPEVTSAPPVDPESSETALTPPSAPSAYEWPEIQMWYLGTRLSSQHREDIVSQIGQLRRLDYRMRRPALADVAEDERYYSRYVPILGTSRHVCGTTFSLKDYKSWLSQRSKLANPGAYLFTWIQTEPVPATNDWRLTAGLKPAVIEPEQIRLQVYAAINAGFRGFGFWNRTSLDADGPGALERRLAIAELNLELELIEPLLAAANQTDIAGCKIEDPRLDPKQKITRKWFDFPQDDSQREREIKQKLAERDTLLKNQKLIPTETDVAVFQGAYYKLVIVTWLAHDAQFVPGTIAANEAKVLIPEPSECAHFWQVTTTGLHPLKKAKTPGGYQVTLPKLDQTAVILSSPDPLQRDPIEERTMLIAPASARICIDLAKTKLDRVQKIDAELTALGHDQPDGRTLLYRAEQFVAHAETAFQQRDYNRAREDAADAMQLLRTLQYAHWNEAVLSQGVNTPLLSPYTVCFQTLPDHWRLVERIGRSADRPQDNLLPSGDFEDPSSVVNEWIHSQHAVEGVRAQARLVSSAHQGKLCLQLIAGPVLGIDPPVVVPKAPVSVTSPPVPVRAGQVLYISGWIRLVSPVTGSLDGVTVHDNLGGMLGALRFRERGGWERFQLLRDVREDADLRLTINLNGMGEVLLDDLKIIPHWERSIRAAGGHRPAPFSKSSAPRRIWNPLDNLRPRESLEPLDGASP